MTNKAIVVGEPDFSRADQRLFIKNSVTYDGTSATSGTDDFFQLGSGSFGVDVELEAIDIQSLLNYDAIQDAGDTIPGSLNIGAVQWVVTTQGTFEPPDQVGVYWHEEQSVMPIIGYEDQGNQTGGIGGGNMLNHTRYLLDIDAIASEVDTTPSAGQDLFLQDELISTPAGANMFHRMSVTFYGREI